MKVKTAAVAIIGLASIGVFHSALRAQRTAPPPQAPATSSEQPSRSVWEGVYTEEQMKRGAALYSQECSSCHGAALTGVEETPPLAGPAFLANWNGLTVGDLSERIRVSMPPNNPRRLSREKIVDILAHVFSANGFPAGKTELERETELLKQIRIEATKP